MNPKVLLILIDGMRPDAVLQAEHPFLREFMRTRCTYTLNGRSVMPSITLPCIMSLFHSVTPDRHGNLDNMYVRPSHRIDGLFDVLYANKKKNLFYRTWNELRDLCRPGALARDELCEWKVYGNAADIQREHRRSRPQARLDGTGIYGGCFPGFQEHRKAHRSPARGIFCGDYGGSRRPR